MNARKYPKMCVLCGVKYVATSGRSKYCPDCRAEAYKASDKKVRKEQSIRRSEEMFKRYKDGVVYTCRVCGRKIRVHERTRRSICNECCMTTTFGRQLIAQRKDLKEEVVED